MIEKHNKYINRCFEIAKNGIEAYPNPLVGAILVYNDTIISEGYHYKCGENHAEVNCINICPSKYIKYIKNCTLYISLEPCSHFGKTPPCTDIIIKNNIKKVVIGSKDIFSEVNGKGIEILKSNNIEVLNLNLEEKQKQLNERFYINNLYKRPFIIAKFAKSADNFIGQLNIKTKISSENIDSISHKYRSNVDAILIGKNTFKIDSPLLTTRHYFGKNSTIIVLDSHIENEYFARPETNIYIINQIDKNESIQQLHYTTIDDTKDILKLVDKIYNLNIKSILIEGGSQILNSFFQTNLVDEIVEIENSKLFLKNGIIAPIFDKNKFDFTSKIIIDDNICTIWKRKI